MKGSAIVIYILWEANYKKNVITLVGIVIQNPNKENAHKYVKITNMFQHRGNRMGDGTRSKRTQLQGYRIVGFALVLSQFLFHGA